MARKARNEASRRLVLTVANASDLPVAAASRFVRDLAQAGWIDEGPPVGGFVRPQFVYGTLCRAGQSAVVRFVRRDDGGTYVRATVSANPCRRRPGSPFREVAMPVLPHPTDAGVTNITSGGGLESHHWNARIGTGLAWPALTSHYVNEMARSSWPPDSRIADDDIFVSLHRSSTTSGEPVVAILTFLGIRDQMSTDAWLRVIRTRASTGGGR